MKQFNYLFEHPEEGRRYLTLEYTDVKDGEKCDAYLSPEIDTPLTERRWIASLESCVVDNPLDYFLTDVAELGYTPVFDKDIYTAALTRGKEIAAFMRTAITSLPNTSFGDARLLTVSFYDAESGLRWDDDDAIAIKITAREENDTHYRLVIEMGGDNAKYGVFECTPDNMVEEIADRLNEMTVELKEHGFLPAGINVLGD